MEGKGERVLLSVRRLSSDQYVVSKFKCSENLVNFLTKEIMLQNHLRFAFCLHSCHLSVRLLCPFPGFAFSSATKAKYISWFVLNFSSALSVPFLSLYVIFFFLLFVPFVHISLFSSLNKPYLRTCFLAFLASSSSPSTDKSHMGVSVELLAAPLQVTRLFFVTAAIVQTCIGGKAAAK